MDQISCRLPGLKDTASKTAASAQAGQKPDKAEEPGGFRSLLTQKDQSRAAAAQAETQTETQTVSETDAASGAASDGQAETETDQDGTVALSAQMELAAALFSPVIVVLHEALAVDEPQSAQATAVTELAAVETAEAAVNPAEILSAAPNAIQADQLPPQTGQVSQNAQALQTGQVLQDAQMPQAEGVPPQADTALPQNPAVVQNALQEPPRTEKTDAAQTGQENLTASAAEIPAEQTVIKAQNGSDTAQDQDGGASGQTEAASQDKTDTTAASSGTAQLFPEVRAVPVKVGEAAVVDTQSPKAQDQMAQVVTNALDQGTTKVTVSLSPESLGTVTVELSRTQDDTLLVVLSADSDRAGALLKQHASGLQTLLENRTAGSVEIQVQKQEQQQSSGDTAYDREGSGGQYQQDSRRQQRNSEDFLQQMRLGLLEVESEAS